MLRSGTAAFKIDNITLQDHEESCSTDASCRRCLIPILALCLTDISLYTKEKVVLEKHRSRDTLYDHQYLCWSNLSLNTKEKIVLQIRASVQRCLIPPWTSVTTMDICYGLISTIKP